MTDTPAAGSLECIIMAQPPSMLRTAAWSLLAAALMFAFAVAGIELARDGDQFATIGLANGVIIALLLRQPARRWPALLSGAMSGNMTAVLFAGAGLGTALVLSAANLLEILTVAGLFRRRFEGAVQLGTVERLATLGLLALAGPLAAVLLGSTALTMIGQQPAFLDALHWLLADILGIVLLVPLLLALGEATQDRKDKAAAAEFLLLLAIAGIATAWLFTRSTTSFFLLTPVLLWAGLRLPLSRAAILVTVTCALGLAMTLSGLGPLNGPLYDGSTQIFLLQAFMGTAVILTLPVAVLSLERGRTADALRQREEHYRLLADHSGDLVMRLSATGEALFVSGAASRLLGLDPDRLTGQPVSKRVHPDDVARLDRALASTMGGGAAETSFRMRQSHGAYRWVEGHFRRCDPAECREPSLVGAPQGVTIIAAVRDIHERWLAEQRAARTATQLQETNRLLLMAEQLASLGHWCFDPAEGMVVLSPEAGMVLGLPLLSIVPADALRLIAAPDRRKLLRSLVLAGRRDEPVQCKLRFNGRSEERTLQLRIQQSGTHPPGLFGVVSDITDRLRADQRLMDALEEARTAASFRSQFLATMSHEIRTPMTGVLGIIDLLGDDTSEEERSLYLQTLRQSADLLMAVLNDILDFSKVDAGHLTFADEPFDLGQTLAIVVRLYDRAASARGLQLRVEGPLPETIWLRGDALRLQQVVSNLVSNAIKFSERGDVSLRCSVQPRANGERHIRLSVEDKGIGIPRDVQRRLFEPFIQGDAAGGRGGTGLGLAISRRLVAGMGGTISVRSAEGRGSTFTVNLTLPAAERPAAQRSDIELAPVRSLDLLMAEDNPVNQLLVSALLKRMGHRVTCVGDGEAAIAEASEKRFDLILMDMQMPRCDGLTAAAAIRSGAGPNARTPIVALTADAAAERRPLYTDRGIDALLTKPVDRAALAATLARLTARPEGPAVDTACPMLDQAVLDQIGAILGAPKLHHLLDLLTAELDKRPATIREALADQDLDRARAEAHSLKGAAANLGAGQVAAAALAVEQAIAQAALGNRQQLSRAVRQLGAAAGETRRAIRSLPDPGAALALGA